MGTFRRGRPFVCSAYRRSGTPPPRSSRTTAETSSAAGTRGTPAPQGAAPLPPPHKSSMVCRASVPTQQRPRCFSCPPYRNAGTMCVLCPSCPVGVWERVVEAGGGGGRVCKRVVHVSLRLLHMHSPPTTHAQLSQAHCDTRNTPAACTVILRLCCCTHLSVTHAP